MLFGRLFLVRFFLDEFLKILDYKYHAFKSIKKRIKKGDKIESILSRTGSFMLPPHSSARYYCSN